MKTLREMMDLIESAQTVDEAKVKANWQLKLVDKREEEYPDDISYEYEFEVYKDGQYYGRAEGDTYYGELMIDPDMGVDWKLSAFHDKNHPLMQQFEKIQDGVNEETRGIDDPARVHELSKQAWERVHAKGKNAFDRFATRMSARALDNVKIDRKTGKVVDEEQLEETTDEAVAKVEQLFRDKR